MNEVVDQESQTQAAQQETRTEVDSSILRVQITYRLVLTGVLAMVGTIALIFLLLWLLPAGLPAVMTLELGISTIGIIGILVGTAVGYLLGSIGKEQADKRADKYQALLLENLQKSHELNGASSL